MKATSLLHRDHQEVKRLFAEIERSRRGNRRSELISELQRALETHARIEEEIFYPALESRRGAQDRVREAYQEHEVVKTMLREVAAMDPGDPDTEARLKVLRENVEHHVEEEEGELFPVAEGMGEQRMEELGNELAERKRSLSEGVVGGVMRGVRSLIFGEEERPRARRRRGAGARTKTRSRTRSRRGRAVRQKRARSASRARAKGARSRQQAARRGRSGQQRQRSVRRGRSGARRARSGATRGRRGASGRRSGRR